MKTDKDYLRQLGNMLGDGVRDQCLPNYMFAAYLPPGKAKRQNEFGSQKL